MEKKEDRRVVMTKRMLKEALTEMLEETDIYHISIRELCKRADINRTTFYKYYGSQFDLFADMEQDILDFISGAITDNMTDTEKMIETACLYLEDKLKFARLIINNNVDPEFPQKLFSLEAIKDSAMRKCSALPSETEAEYMFTYMTYGAYRIISFWLNKEERESSGEIARILSKMLLS